MQKVYNVYADPGHAWAKVPFKVLYALGIAEKISSYSYVRNGYAYLEEDCDLSTFIVAFREKTGLDPKFMESWTNKYSKIRGYNSYTYGSI
jgi:hypothetical protein